MQQGKLGSVVAGVLAIFLVIICLFYVSFTFVNNHYEDQAKAYALRISQDEASDAHIKANKHFIDSIANEKVWLGYTFKETQKLGVGLGLDLKGGMNVTLQMSVPDILRSMAKADGNRFFEKAIQNTDSVVKATKSNDYVSIFCEEYKKVDPQGDLAVVFRDKVKRGASAQEVESMLKNEVKDRVSSSTNVLRNRIDQFGVVSPNIQELEKDGQVLLELPGVKDHDRMLDLLKASANLEFYETTPVSEIRSALTAIDRAIAQDSTIAGKTLGEYFALNTGNPIVFGSAVKANKQTIDEILARPNVRSLIPSNVRLAWSAQPTIYSRSDKNYDLYPEEIKGQINLAGTGGLEVYDLYLLKTTGGKPALSGDVISSASAEYDDRQGNYVSMTMTGEAAAKWASVTGANVGKPVAVVLDGEVYSAPNVNDKIEGGRSTISGHFTTDEAKDLANVLKSGKMDASVDVISATVIGPSLGQQAIHDGFMSFIIALVLLMIFMMAFYGVIPGLIANLGLIFNIFFTFGILASFQAVLTLSGIAGIVLALGMAVDANVLIFERAKEELRAGKNTANAIADGYSNAFSAIFDSNLTSIITGVILLMFGTGPIKGFATTLIIGIICSFFTAVFLTRLVFIAFGKTKAFKNLTFTTALSRKMFTNSHFNFLNARKVAFPVCGVLILVIIGSFFVKGLNNGIDFSGGRNYVVQFDHNVNTQDIHALLAPKFEGAGLNVITIDTPNKVRVSTNYKIDSDDPNVDNEITSLLYAGLKGELNGMSEADFSTANEEMGIISSQKVGPTVANDMRTGAVIAVILSLLAMFLYILVRFRNIAFSVGALAAVAFTAFSIIGFYSLFWGVFPFAMEIDQTFIAAILTVIGYQINDTVVVFDRVRENIALYPKQDFYTNVNTSINSTLGRTVMTSASTLLVLLCIFILGGDAIRSFTFAMIFGVVIGTLATMFVAAPVAYLTNKRNTKKAAKK